jgi:hypothetical protein
LEVDGRLSTTPIRRKGRRRRPIRDLKMKRLYAAAIAGLMLAGATNAGFAEARQDRTPMADQKHRSHHHHRICRPIYKNKVVWKHHRRHVVRVKVGTRCR